MRKKLLAHNYASVADVRQAPKERLVEILGAKEGELAYNLCRGRDDEPVLMTGLAKTMSSEDNLGMCRDKNVVMAELQKQLSMLLKRIDDEYHLYGRLPRTLRLAVCSFRWEKRGEGGERKKKEQPRRFLPGQEPSVPSTSFFPSAAAATSIVSVGRCPCHTASGSRYLQRD